MKKMSLNSVSGKTSKAIAIVALALVYVCSAENAWAKDSMSVTVSGATGSPVIVKNGAAAGTIQLFYTVNASAFPIGWSQTFKLNWVTTPSARNATDYGTGITFVLTQDQQGGYVDLAPSPDTFNLTATNRNGYSTVTVSIVPDKNGHLPLTVDGTDLVGNLKLAAGPDVNTVTNIQVHILLVHPTDCLKVYNFVTDQESKLETLDETTLNVPTRGSKAGKVNSSTPGQFSDNVLVVNTCGSPHSFDLRIGLDSSFAVQGANAVKTYSAAGEFNSSNFEPLLSGTEANKQQNLCLENVTVPADSSFLATVHSKIVDDLPQSLLPADGTFDFAASVHDQVNTGCAGPLYSVATPNPATFSLPFTIN